jgi:hypothetical protein
MKLHKLLSLTIVLSLLVACDADDEAFVPDSALQISGITATLSSTQAGTRATEESTTLGVGRTAFADGNVIVFTTIKRTDNPLDYFSYSNIQYSYNGSGWKRSKNGTEKDPEKIYWSDVTSAHTFTGYCLPSSSYYWKSNPTNNIVTYQGELGYGVDDKGTIDFSTGNESIVAEDLLVSHSKNVKPDTGGASAQVDFKHALSNVCVVVNVKGFATNALDKKVDVSDMVILNQPCVFTWGADTTVLSTLNVTDTNNKTKNIKLWRKSVSGENEDKTLVFYGLTTPQDADYRKINGNGDNLSFKFTVKYPNALDASQTVTHTYKGSVSDEEGDVLFNSGKCTTINVSLNHRNEQMLVDVNYSDWNYVASPDLGKLRKKSTYMEMTIDNVSTHFDNGLTIDNATWLYIDHNDEDKVKDVYGNDGNLEHPYVIKSAAQLLSFAKEVNNGYSFSGDYIRLDADITMQASTAKTNVESETSTVKPVAWIGIGEDGKPFNGTFLGGDRYINRLYGKPLFVNLGALAVVEQLHIAPIGTITGGGALAETNAGTIGGCKVVEDVTLSTDGEAGALVGKNIKTENSIGTIYACYHIGNASIVRTDKTTGTAGLVGSNEGTIVGCYHAGDTFTIANTNTGTIKCPEATSIYQIQQKDFVEALNKKLTEWNLETKFQFVHNSASYPTVTIM